MRRLSNLSHFWLLTKATSICNSLWSCALYHFRFHHFSKCHQGTETWVCDYGAKTKIPSFQWKSPRLPCVRTAHQSISNIKVICVFRPWWNCGIWVCNQEPWKLQEFIRAFTKWLVKTAWEMGLSFITMAIRAMCHLIQQFLFLPYRIWLQILVLPQSQNDWKVNIFNRLGLQR